MRRLSFVILLLCALLATTGIAAAERPATAGKPDHAGAGKPDRRNFVVHLTPEQEVRTPAVESDAKGTAVFHLSKDGNTLRWMLIVTNIENVTMAHIHGPATPTENKGVLLTLFDKQSDPFTGEQNGLLMRGTITRGSDPDFDATLTAMRAGNAYVNVHTTRYTGGEIRGQFGVKGGFGRGENHGGGAETDDDAKPQKQRGQGQGNQGQGQGRGRGQGGQGDDD